MDTSDAIITPTPGRHPAAIGDLCVMIGNPDDLACFCRLAALDEKYSRGLLMSRLFWEGNANPRFCAVGPFVGAPYAVILQEIAVSWGVRQIIFFGWCGAIETGVKIGEVILPTDAWIDDGTSGNYLSDDVDTVSPSDAVQQRIKRALTAGGIGYREGRIWSTDAIYRETAKKVSFYRGQQALAVEMEAAALFSVAAFRSIDVGCVLVVSDELSDDKWVRGFSAPAFTKARKAACKTLCDLVFDKDSGSA